MTSAMNTRPASSRAFTLTELVVAVGSAALLTAAVGVLFRSVGDLSSAGTSAAKLDSAARIIERRLRDDFASLSELAVDETFFAIRFREVGDINRNGRVDAATDERAIYLTPADRDADVNAQVDPYDTSGQFPSRAVTTRLDEMIFLARGSYLSAQLGQRPVEAAHARISWGHGLRPLRDPDFTGDADTATGAIVPPRRQYVPDGDFGTRAGETFDFAPGTGVEQAGLRSSGRNEHAANFPLTRHQLLLYGGNAPSNHFDPTMISDAPASPWRASQPIGDRLFAPYISDVQTFDRFGEWTFSYNDMPDLGDRPKADREGIAEPMWIQSGRVDIAMQDLADVRRWLEGELPRPTQNDPINYAGAYGAGPFNDPLASLGNPDAGVPASGAFDARPLWSRFTSPPNDGAALLNLVAAQSAIAGVFSRILVDDEPPIVGRRFDPTQTDPNEFRESPSALAMDTHALIAANCSRFEIAWTDGSYVNTANGDGLDVNNDGVIDYRNGDLVWFDISPIVDRTGAVLRRNTLADWLGSSDAQFVRFANPLYNRDANIPLNDLRTQAQHLFPEVLNSAASDLITATSDEGGLPARDLFVGAPLLYDRVLTGGAVRPGGGDGSEAYAIWGFREPLANGRYGRPWPKPAMIRVRMTLHDRDQRTPEGKTYEFILPISLRTN